MAFAGTARFSLLAKLGEGGMGIVYEAYDHRRDMRVALKTLRRAGPAYLYHFKREFRALSGLSHPNIVTLYELLSEGGSWFLTMELVDGPDFITYVRHGLHGAPGPRTASTALDDLETRTSGNLEPAPQGDDDSGVPGAVAPELSRRITIADVADVPRLREASRQLAHALHALHGAGVVHRDLKPSNVRVTGDGRVVLMDFGIVAERGVQQAPGLGGVVGTPTFMAPEQAGKHEPTAAADWYAFGVMLYVALTGQLPFQGPGDEVLRQKCEHDPLPPSVFVADIPADLERLCMQLLQRDPAARPNYRAVLEVVGSAVPEVREAGELSQPVAVPGDFVGRRRELGLLHQAYASARAGRGACVLMQGLSGMGKSRLIEHFLETVLEPSAADEPLVFSGRCHERETVAYKAFDGIVDSICHYLMSLPPGERAAVLPADMTALSRVFPVLLQVMDPAPVQSLEGRNPLEVRTQAIEGVRALLVELAQRRTTIVCIEDMQWADRDSMDVLLALLRPPAPAGLLVLCTLRTESLAAEGSPHLTEAVATLSHRDFCRTITVGPLSDDEQRELLARLGQRRQLRGSIDDRLRRELAGHPLLLVELVRYLQDESGGISPGRSLHVEDVIWRRVSRLPAASRSLMEVIAVAGEPLPLGLLAAAAGLSDQERERAATLVCVGHLARVARIDHEPWLDRFHDKVREAIVARLPAERVRFLHVQLAHALESWAEAPVASMAHHWLAAGDPQQAALYLLEAGRTAAHQLAFERAAALYRAGLSLIPEGSHSRRLQVARCRALLGLAEGMRMVDRDDEVLELVGRAHDVAEQHGLTEELARLHYLRGTILFPRGDLRGCLAEHEKSHAYARRSRSPESEALALSGLGDAHYMHGRMRSAQEHFDACIALCDAHGFSGIKAANLPMRGLTRFYQLDLEGALADGREAVRLARQIGHQRAEIVARASCLAFALLELGRIDEARAEAERALGMLRAVGARRFEVTCLAGLARALVLENRLAEAADMARRGVERARAAGMAFAGPMALGTLALATDDERERALAVREAVAILDAGTIGHNHLHVHRDVMDAALRTGDMTMAQGHAAALERYTAHEPLPWSDFMIARTRVLARHQAGDEGAARDIALLCEQGRSAGLHVAVRALQHALEQDQRNTVVR